MAASDARWPPLKNTAWRVTFPLLDADGDLVANGAGDTPDCERSIDNANFADCSNEMVEIEVNSGFYYLDLNASEMNGNCIAIIAKTATAGTKTTPIVVYPVSDGFNELGADHTKTQSDIALIDAAIDSDSTALGTKLDSDMTLLLADHDKTQSDILLIDGAIDSDSTALDTKLDSDMTLLLADHDKTQSDIALLGGDATEAKQDTIISDILLLSGKADSDQVLNLADHDKTQSDITDLSTKVDSDAVLADADHDKTQSDVALLSTKVDSDAVLADADHDKTQSDVALLSTKVDSDAVLAGADHDKSQSDIVLLSDKADSDQTLGVMLAAAQTQGWASGLEASAGTIKEGVAEAGTLSTTQMSTDLTEVNDVFNGRILIFKADTTTAALRLQATAISDYAQASGVLTFTAVTTAPSAGDTFVIV